EENESTDPVTGLQRYLGGSRKSGRNSQRVSNEAPEQRGRWDSPEVWRTPAGSHPHVSPKYSCARRTTIEPSPTAEATRFIAPDRTSPAANTPGMLVSSVSGSRRSFHA